MVLWPTPFTASPHPPCPTTHPPLPIWLLLLDTTRERQRSKCCIYLSGYSGGGGGGERHCLRNCRHWVLPIIDKSVQRLSGWRCLCVCVCKSFWYLNPPTVACPTKPDNCKGKIWKNKKNWNCEGLFSFIFLSSMSLHQIWRRTAVPQKVCHIWIRF